MPPKNASKTTPVAPSTGLGSKRPAAGMAVDSPMPAPGTRRRARTKSGYGDRQAGPSTPVGTSTRDYPSSRPSTRGRAALPSDTFTDPTQSITVSMMTGTQDSAPTQSVTDSMMAEPQYVLQRPSNSFESQSQMDLQYPVERLDDGHGGQSRYNFQFQLTTLSDHESDNDEQPSTRSLLNLRKGGEAWSRYAAEMDAKRAAEANKGKEVAMPTTTTPQHHGSTVGGSGNVVPGTPATGNIEARFPAIFFKPTRANLIKLRHNPPPKLFCNKTVGRAILDNEVVDDLDDDDDAEQGANAGNSSGSGSAVQAQLLPDEYTKLEEAWKLSLFLWCNSHFAGYYVKKIIPSISGGSERFLLVRQLFQRRFSSLKTNFIWRYAYLWAVELAVANPNLVELALGDNMIAFSDVVVPFLNSNSFKQFFHPVRAIIDFNGTMATKPHGKYFIETIFTSFCRQFLRLYSREKELNMRDNDGDTQSEVQAVNPNSMKWKHDKTLRDRILSDFSGWGYMEEFMRVGHGSFVYLSNALQQSRSKTDMKAARASLVVARPPPDAPEDADPFGAFMAVTDTRQYTTLEPILFFDGDPDPDSQTLNGISPPETPTHRPRPRPYPPRLHPYTQPRRI
ncbi:hypothetical protein B0T25DRAFT_582166 [Lasiosphaeria hispida]|uniref:Uncharacterized protein n=1 Tax=Lasiosphaeria hispida TaxID=260671 RepID=A0AAJ0MC26_9PEZI|nr:hypothetical protein B0T25DRAFT_582166 [Lasiosphaeria hispida]